MTLSLNNGSNKRNETYSDITNVIQEQPSLKVPCDNVNAACNCYTDDFVMSDNIFATMPTTPFAIDGHIDLTTQSYPESYNGQVSTQNPPQPVMDTPSYLQDNSLNMTLNLPQMPTDNSEIFRFAIPGFQIVVIPTFSHLNDFNMQYQVSTRCFFFV